MDCPSDGTENEGGLNRARRCCRAKSYGLSHGANTAQNTRATRTTPPNTASRWRRNLRQVTRASDSVSRERGFLPMFGSVIANPGVGERVGEISEKVADQDEK